MLKRIGSLLGGSQDRSSKKLSSLGDEVDALEPDSSLKDSVRCHEKVQKLTHIFCWLPTKEGARPLLGRKRISNRL